MVVPPIFWTATVLVGAVVGFLVGASKSPLASAALPIFASLLTASVTIFLTAKPGKLPAPDWYAPIAKGYLFLLAGFVPAFFGGVVLRVGPAEYLAIGPMLIDWGQPDSYGKLKNREEREVYVLVSANLSALGLDDLHKRAFLSALVDEERAQDPTGMTPPTEARLKPDPAKRFQDALDKFADCAGNQASEVKLSKSTADDLKLSARAMRDLQGQITASANIPAPRPLCSLGCKIDFLRSSVAQWANDSTLAMAEVCGLTVEERKDVNDTVAALLNFSPLLEAALELQERGEAFHKAWESASGNFTSASSPASVALPVEEEIPPAGRQ